MITLEKYAEEIGIQPEELKGRSKIQEIVTPRQVYWYYLKSKRLGYSQIARMFSRTHGTIIAGINRIQGLKELNDPYVQKCFKALSEEKEDNIPVVSKS